jgi:hypothetical protein
VSRELISKKTRNEFREYLTGWVVRQIEMEFDAAGIACHQDYSPNLSGVRRSLVEQYYATLDFTNWTSVSKLLSVYENVLDSASQANPRAFTDLCKWLRKDGFEFTNGRIVSITRTASLSQAKHIAVEFSASYMTDQIARMEQSVETDPALAVGSAKELIETCCRTILHDRNLQPVANLDLSQLVKATLKELDLLPEDVSDKAKGSDIIKRLLSNLATVTQGLAELRNLYGSGHGKDGRSRGLKPRHTKLAVGAATALTVFLFETHRESSVLALSGAKPPANKLAT